ncbi:hypothetical protein H311_05263, partial [Anncaliia algerae PRA109]
KTIILNNNSYKQIFNIDLIIIYKTDIYCNIHFYNTFDKLFISFLLFPKKKDICYKFLIFIYLYLFIIFNLFFFYFRFTIFRGYFFIFSYKPLFLGKSLVSS